jgi:acetyl esterase/lipase
LKESTVNRIFRFFVLTFLAACQPRPASSVEPAAAQMERLDLAYPAPEGGDASVCTLDVHWRNDRRPKRPVLLVHGGSWVGGDKANFSEQAPDLVTWFLDRGYVVVAPNFRLATGLGEGDAVQPLDQVEDLAQALGWLERNGDTYGVTDSRPVLLGFSSGAHLVALLGADESSMEDVGLPSDHIVATVSLDVHAYDVPYALELMEGSDVAQNIPFIEHLFGETAQLQLAASPIHHVDGYVADALLIGAEPDISEEGTKGWVVHRAAQNYVDALTAGKHLGRSAHFEGKSHSGLVMGFGEVWDGPTRTVGTFLDDLGL